VLSDGVAGSTEQKDASMSPELHLAVALDGTGWHPASWRQPDARPAELFTATYWTDLVQEAERGVLDFVTFEDSLGLQSSKRSGPDGRTDQVRGRLDAVLIASRVAPKTSGIGLVPTVVMAHTEPFHISKAIATLDYVSAGRAGLRVQAGNLSSDPAHFGRRPTSPFRVEDRENPDAAQLRSDLFDETRDYIEVVRRLWDSWEDDAEIRDAATGRFVDREKLHYIDFEGQWFSVKGPSITPRPPQGQPVVSVLAHATVPYRLAGRAADVVYVTPHDESDVVRIRDEVRQEQAAAGRADDALFVLADLVVFLDEDAFAAESRKRHLDDLDGSEYVSDAGTFVGTPSELAELVVAWHAAGVDGFRFRPGALPHDLEQITRSLVPILQRGSFRDHYETSTLRSRFGLERPASRYALAGVDRSAGA
jgi:alkanesulfonate monooxygenase SsuD/methylene tetrahydromethanopterin reductase-like flavin-dependent oxidoreductase (luciferase family)